MADQEFKFRRLSQWYEHDSLVLWVDNDFNQTHEVYFGSPLCSDWPFTEEKEVTDNIFWIKLPNVNLQ